MSHTIKAYKHYLLNFLFIELNIQGHVAFHRVLCSPYFLSKSVETCQNIHGINFWSIQKITNTHPKKLYKLIEKHVQFLWSGWKQEIHVQTNNIQNHQFSKGISSLTLIAGILLKGRKNTRQSVLDYSKNHLQVLNFLFPYFPSQTCSASDLSLPDWSMATLAAANSTSSVMHSTLYIHFWTTSSLFMLLNALSSSLPVKKNANSFK